MLPQQPGIFSQALMGLAGPEDPEMAGMGQEMPPMDPMMADPMAGMGGMGPEMGGMPMEYGPDPMMGPEDPMAAMMEPPQEQMEDPSAEETRVVEDLIRNYLYEQGRKRMEATRQYQQNVADANERQF